MVFKNKFFLDLSSGGEQQAPVTIAPPTAKPEPQPKVNTAASQPEPQPAGAAGAAEVPTQPTTSLTTAEAIAAELAAEQASRPAPTLSTFAPKCVTAGGALSRGRRRGSADLGGFRAMARGMLSS